MKKINFPRSEGVAVAREIVRVLEPCCSRLIVAGSLRRRKNEVGDVEILYIPKRVRAVDPSDLFQQTVMVNETDKVIEDLLAKEILTKRLNVNGSETWGPENKLSVHRFSGIPVDLFSTNEACWFNYVVCRTGGADTNTRIATQANKKGWKWNPYGPGFTQLPSHGHGKFRVACEQDVFSFVCLPYQEPWERL